MNDSNVDIEKHYKWYVRDVYNRKHRDVRIIEDYIANRFSIRQLSVKFNLSEVAVSYIIGRYFEKPSRNIVLKSKV